MIGVMASAVVPGRIGEPTRIVVLSRRLEGSARRLLPIVTGTVFSQTLINLLALAILASVTFSSIPLGHGHSGWDPRGRRGPAGAVRARAARPAPAAPRPALALAARAPGERDASRGCSGWPGRACIVFVTPRHGIASVAAQLLAWTLQWLACYAVVLALGLPAHPQLIAAAAVLLAVNVSAILPATPSNVGVFQAACLVVLAAYGVGAGPGDRLRHRPAGRRGPHGARPRHPGAARGGADLAGHPLRAGCERRETRMAKRGDRGALAAASCSYARRSADGADPSRRARVATA